MYVVPIPLTDGRVQERSERLAAADKQYLASLADNRRRDNGLLLRVAVQAEASFGA